MADCTSTQGDDDWRQLGLADLHLRIARTVFDTPADAQPWVDALTHYAPNAETLREVVSSGSSPSEFMAWRAAGVDSWNVVSWSKALARAELTHEHMKRWRSAGHKASILPALVPYLTDDVTFDDVLDVLSTWSADGLLGLLESGIDVGTVTEMRRSGVSGHVLDSWSSSSLPVASWKDWMERNVSAEAAERFHSRGMDAATAEKWLQPGLSLADAEALIDSNVPIDTVVHWFEAGIAPADTAAFIGAGVSLTEAQEWIEADITVADAVDFVRGGVPLAVAAEWLEKTELSARDVIDFVQKDVSLEQALEFEKRGIGSHQVSRTDAGLELDLDPWQEDPAEQLQSVIEPGRIQLTLWTEAFGDHPQGFDVSFTWDGDHSASWHEDIAMSSGMSVMSSSPSRGILAWPNGKDVELTYCWTDFGLEGYDAIAGMAPADSQTGVGASNPQFWIRLGYAIIDFVLENHGSGDSQIDYHDTVDDAFLDLNDMFQRYVDQRIAVTHPTFGAWLDEVVASGRYSVDGDE